MFGLPGFVAGLREGPLLAVASALLLSLSGTIYAQGRTVNLSSLAWPPYVGEALPDGGFVNQLVKEALQRAGLELDTHFRPWARAVEMARRGETAGVFPEYYDPARERDFLFSEPFPGGPIGLYKRRDSDIAYATDPRKDQHTALWALKAYRFGVVRGYANTPMFDRADFLLKEEVTTDALNLKKLAFGRVDLIVIDQFVADYLLRTELNEYADQLIFMEPALEIKTLHVAFSRAHPHAAEWRTAFNRGLAAMRADGSLKRFIRSSPLSGQ